MNPQRIQLSRKRGWRKPEGAIVVARPSKWGNPWRALPTGGGWSVFYRLPSGLDWWLERVGVVSKDDATAECVRLFRLGIESWAEDEFGDSDNPLSDALAPLRGHDLCCWCPLDSPCHADVLLELANQ